MTMLYWLTQTYQHYNHTLFSSLHEAGVPLTVAYLEAKRADYPIADTATQPPYALQVLQHTDCLRLAARCHKGDAFVFGSWHRPELLACMEILRHRGIPFFLWTDTPRLEGSSQKCWKRALRPWVLRRVLAQARECWGTGPLACQRLVTLGASEATTFPFPYWIDPSQYPVSQQPPREARFLIVGRMVEEKGIRHGLAALRKARRLGLCQVTLEFIGEGPCRPFLENEVRAGKETSWVRFSGWLGQAALKARLADATCLVHAAPFEPYGVVVLEAMAAGLAVFASDGCGAALDRILHAQNGFIHRAGDVESLAEQVVTAHQDEDALLALRGKARETALNWKMERAVDFVLARIGQLGNVPSV